MAYSRSLLRIVALLLVLGLGPLHANEVRGMEYGDQVAAVIVALSTTTLGYSSTLAEQGVYAPLAVGLVAWGIIMFNIAGTTNDSPASLDQFARSHALALASDVSRGGGPWLSAYLALAGCHPAEVRDVSRQMPAILEPAQEAQPHAFAIGLRYELAGLTALPGHWSACAPFAHHWRRPVPAI